MPSSNGEYSCSALNALRTLVNSASRRMSPASTRSTSRAPIPTGRSPNGSPAANSASHTSTPAAELDPQLVADVARVAGPGDVHRDAGDGGHPAPEVLEVGPVFAGRRLEHLSGQAPLEGEGADLGRDVLDPHVEAGGVHDEPPVVRLGRRPSIRGLVEPADRPVVDELAALVAPRRVVDLPDGELGRVPGDDPVDQPRRRPGPRPGT